MTDRTKENILRCIGNFVSLYKKRVLKIETILADPEFSLYEDEIRKKFGITLKLASKGRTRYRSRTAHNNFKINIQRNMDLLRLEIEIVKKGCYCISLKWPDMDEQLSTKNWSE